MSNKILNPTGQSLRSIMFFTQFVLLTSGWASPTPIFRHFIMWVVENNLGPEVLVSCFRQCHQKFMSNVWKICFFTRNRVSQVILKVTSSISYFVLFINRKGQFVKFSTFVVPFPVAYFESWIKNSSFWTGHYHSFSPLSVLGH